MNALERKTAIQSLQIQQMFSAGYTSIVTGVTLSAILAYLQREVIASAVVVGWLSLIVLVSLSRAIFVITKKRTTVGEYSAIHARILWFRLGVLASGLAWGSASFLMFPENDQQHQMFLVFMIAGLTAGGVASYSADLISGLGYSILALVPLIIRLFIQGNSLSVAMSMAVLLYLGFLIVTLRNNNQRISENIVLRLDATDREETLRESKERVEASEERYRLLLTHSPIGIFHYDTNLLITYCNDRLADILHNSIDRIVGQDMKTLKDQSIVPTLRRSLEGAVATYEGHYRATFSDADLWISLNCAPIRDVNGNVVSGVGIVEDVTKRKQTENALQQSERRLRTIIETEPECIKVVDSTGHLVEMNAAGLAMLEAGSLEEAQQKDLLDYVDQEDQAVYLSLLDHVIHGESGTGEFKIRGLRGTTRYLETHAAPMRDPSDNKTLFLAVTRDITESKQTEALLKESEIRFRTVIEQSPLGISLSRDGYTIDGNAAFLQMFGYDDIAEVRGQPVTDRIAPQRRAEMEDRIMRRSRNEPVEASYETVGLRKDGSQFPLFIWAKRVMLSNGPLSCAFLLDITERKQAEASLKESELRFHTIIEQSPIGMGIGTLDGRFLQVNRAFCDIFGYTKDELERMSFQDLTYPDDMAISEKQMRQMREGQISSYRLEKRYIRKDGQVIWALLSLTVVTDDSGVSKYAIGQIVDITERKKAEAEIRIAATAFESREGMLITDADSVILRVNRAFTEITGYTIEDVIGMNPRILSSGRQDDKFYAAMWQSINDTGAWEGELWNRRKNGEIYPERLSITAVKDLNGNVVNYVAAMTDITLSKKSEQEINQLAFFDPLTHLPNRRLLMDRLNQALVSSGRSDRQGALLFIDLDNFKTLNDTLGHDIGDLLLQQVAERLLSCVREGDTVARLGGDEFVVMLEDLSGPSLEAASQAEAVGEKILASLSQLYQLAMNQFRCSASIGAILFDNKQQPAEELMKQADIAMYQAKKAGRNTLRFFDPQMQDAINTRAALEGELHKALEKQQFQLYYQIQVDRSGHALGAEALIRWVHPEHGLVSPAQFIQLAEDTGLILPIGLWVLDTACAQLKAWQNDALTRNLVLAVNVSAKQFRETEFVAQVRAAVRRHGIKPLRLKLELTESLLLENIEAAIEKMRTLKELGVRLSLDDFGTGYSSLFYLKRLPLDQIKIDQSFVRNITTDKGDVVMVRTIVELGMNFELEIVAEGLETDTQFKLLHRYGATGFQGYLFSKPVPIEQFEELLKQD